MNETWEVEGKIINAVAYMLLIALERMKTISETAENGKPKKKKNIIELDYILQEMDKESYCQQAKVCDWDKRCDVDKTYIMETS